MAGRLFVEKRGEITGTVNETYQCDVLAIQRIENDIFSKPGDSPHP